MKNSNVQKKLNIGLKKGIDRLFRFIAKIHFGIMNTVGFVGILVGIIIIVLLNLIQTGMTDKLEDQNITARWSKEGGYASIALYYPYKAEVDELAYRRAMNTVDTELKAISMVPENSSQRLAVAAILSEGSVNVSTDNGTATPKAYGTEGDFFMFHPMNFVSGEAYQPDALMKDYAVIDDTLAWKLFGAVDVAGMTFKVGDTTHIVSGVIHIPDDKLSLEAGATAGIIFLDSSSLKDNGSVNTVVSFELMMPEPYDGYAFSICKKCFSEYENDGEWIDTTKRFDFMQLFNKFKNRRTLVMQKKPIAFPYWENIARFYENKFLKFLYVKSAMWALVGIFAAGELISIIGMLRAADGPDKRRK